MASKIVATAQLNIRIDPVLLQRLRLFAVRNQRHVQRIVSEGIERVIDRKPARRAA